MGSNPGHSHCRRILYQLIHQGSPKRFALGAAIRIRRGRQTEEKYHRTFLMLLFSHSHNQLFATPWASAHQAPLSFTISRTLLKLMFIELVMPSNHLIFCHPLLLPPLVFPSIRVFSNESALRVKWPKYLSFNFSPSNEYSGLISFWIDWFDMPNLI